MEENLDFVIHVESNLSDEENQDVETPELDIDDSEIQYESSELNMGTRIRFEPSEQNIDTRIHSKLLELRTDPGIDHSESSELNLDTEIRFESVSESPQQNNNTSITSASIPQCRICGVPQHIREEDERAYRPRIVSVGPFHYKKPGLEAMEAQKLKFLHRMLVENDERELLSNLLGAMKKLESKTRKCYSEDFNTISSDEFVKMMLVDGCFIIELFRLNAKMRQGQVVNDPIFATRWIVPNLRQDLLMLENQLPLFILHEIFRLAGYSKEDETSLNRLALQFFESVWPNKGRMPTESSTSNIEVPTESSTSNIEVPTESSTSNIEVNSEHLLALFQSSFICSYYQPETTSSSSLLSSNSNLSMKGWIRNAERLKQAGLILERKSGNLLDIELLGARLKIPTLFIGSGSKPILRNLVVYEQASRHAAPYFTSLVFLFYSLIDTPEDAKLLQQKEIVITGEGISSEEVVALFGSLSKDIVLDLNDRLLTKQVEDINRYSQIFWAKIFTVAYRRFSRNFVKVVVSSIFFYLTYSFLHQF